MSDLPPSARVMQVLIGAMNLVASHTPSIQHRRSSSNKPNTTDDGPIPSGAGITRSRLPNPSARRFLDSPPLSLSLRMHGLAGLKAAVAESARAFHPEPFTDPDMNLSIHPPGGSTHEPVSGQVGRIAIDGRCVVARLQHWRAHASNNASPTPKTRKGSRVSATPAIDVLLLPTAEARSTAAEISIAGIGATDRWSAWLRLLF
jgi:hypothetical protein